MLYMVLYGDMLYMVLYGDMLCMVLYGDMLCMVLYGDMRCMVLYGDMDQICRGDPAHTDVQSIFSSVMKLQKTISQICYKILAVSLQ